MTERWVKMVEKHVRSLERAGKYLNGPAMLRSEAVKLLARQHQAFVRMVERIHQGKYVPEYRRIDCETYTQGYLDCRNDTLAALAKRKGGG